jgi:flagellin
MSITIFTNVPAQKAIGQSRLTTQSLSRTFERLSSGLRITRAADDAAGLSIAENLRSDTRIATAAIRNVNDGLSFVAVAESALGEISNILVRMAELAEQSSNGTLSATQKSPLFLEFVALGSEINRIVSTTKFNDITVLSYTQTIKIQVGFDSNSNSQIPLRDYQLSSDRLGLNLNSQNYMNIDTVKTAIESVAQMQEYNAARLEFAKSNLQGLKVNYATAESQIRDADIAAEAANLVKFQILNQANIAVLAQANLQPSFALKLLPSIIE